MLRRWICPELAAVCVLLLALVPQSGWASEEENPPDAGVDPGQGSMATLLYHERHQGNSFTAAGARLGGNINRAETLFFHVLFEARLGRAWGGDGEYHRFVSLPLGFGLAYAMGPARIYAEGGWDLLELIANDLVTSEEDAQAGNSEVDVDTFFGLGLELRLNPCFALDLRARYNDISGVSIRDDASWYGGLGLVYRY